MRRRPHKEVARLARRVLERRSQTPRPTVRQIARELGISYWTARHYVNGECKALYRLGR